MKDAFLQSKNLYLKEAYFAHQTTHWLRLLKDSKIVHIGAFSKILWISISIMVKIEEP